MYWRGGRIGGGESYTEEVWGGLTARNAFAMTMKISLELALEKPSFRFIHLSKIDNTNTNDIEKRRGARRKCGPFSLIFSKENDLVKHFNLHMLMNSIRFNENNACKGNDMFKTVDDTASFEFCF